MKLTTTVYKYKRSAPWMIVLIVLATVLFFFFSTTFHPLMNASGPGGRMKYTTEYGDRNTITFVYRGIPYDWTFYLGTFNHYDTLVQIMQRWREKGINFSARSAFTDSYIRKQENRFG